MANIQKNSIPLTFTWACTVQKVQGIARSTTVVSLELLKQAIFCQINVTLSRSTSPSKLNILSNFDPLINKHNHLALNHYEYLRKENNLFIYQIILAKEIVEC